MLDDVLLQLGIVHVRGVLGGHHHGMHPQGAAVLVFHGNLGLAVGAQVGQLPALTYLSQAAGEPVGQGDGQGHVLGGFVAGIAEHHALISRASIELILRPALQGVVHTHGDVAGLLVHADQHRAGIAVKAIFGPVIADIDHLLPGDLVDGYVGRGSDLPHHQDHAGGRSAFAGYPGHGVLFQNSVQHRVGNLVADLIRMSFSDRLRSKQGAHGNVLLL